MRSKKLHLKRDQLAHLSDDQLGDVAGAGVQTLQSGCQSGVRACDPPTYQCFTHTTSLDCTPTELCPTNGCG